MLTEEEVKEAQATVEASALASESTARIDLVDEAGGGAVVYSVAGDQAVVVITEGDPSLVSI